MKFPSHILKPIVYDVAMNERGKADVYALAHANRRACGEMSESIRSIANKDGLEVVHGCMDEN